MSFSLRTTLAAVVAAGAVAIAAVPASAAISPRTDHAGAGAWAVANPPTIHAAAYNKARSILAQAGSQTAAKSHPVHGKPDVPVNYGTSLLAAARDEFRRADAGLPADQKRSDMSIAHYNAIHSAASTMGIDRW